MRHVARKRFGQHFLVDDSVIACTVAAIAPRPHDVMLEIGPGLGALTRALAGRVGQLLALEIDRDIVARLKAEFAPELVSVLEGDALAHDYAAHGPDLRVVGNLPYNISTPLLFWLAQFAAHIRDVHVMLQKEVVERMVATPSSPQYGRLSVMLQYRFEIEKLIDVPAQAFHPAPKVQSAFVRLLPLAVPVHPACDESSLARVVAAAFGQRRKILRNTLRSFMAPEQLAALGIDPGARAETLSVEQFVRIANALAKDNGARALTSSG